MSGNRIGAWQHHHQILERLNRRKAISNGQALLKLQLIRDSHLAADCYRRCAALFSHRVDSKLVTSAEEAAMRAGLKNSSVAAVERVNQPDCVLIRQKDPDARGVDVPTYRSDHRQMREGRWGSARLLPGGLEQVDCPVIWLCVKELIECPLKQGRFRMHLVEQC